MQTNFLSKEFLTILKKTLLFLFLGVLLSLRLSAQDSREELSERYLNVGKYLIQSGNYDSASIVLKSAFIKGAVLPDELLFYYSLVLYKKQDLDQSKKFIDKYISISSPKAELFNQAIELEKSISNSIDANSVECSSCKGIGFHYHECEACDGTGEQMCNTCKGKGKVLIGGAQGMRFGMCTTCMGDGKRSCTKCVGKKELSEVCTVCKGKGKIKKAL